MIEISKLTEKDVGKWVLFQPPYQKDKSELGKIKSWNKTYIYVVYRCAYDWNNFKNYTSVPTDPDTLIFSEGDECERRFGVKILTGANLDLICKECGLRLGLHCGTSCPTKSEILYEGRDYDSSVKEANDIEDE